MRTSCEAHMSTRKRRRGERPPITSSGSLTGPRNVFFFFFFLPHAGRLKREGGVPLEVCTYYVRACEPRGHVKSHNDAGGTSDRHRPVQATSVFAYNSIAASSSITVAKSTEQWPAASLVAKWLICTENTLYFPVPYICNAARHWFDDECLRMRHPDLETKLGARTSCDPVQLNGRQIPMTLTSSPSLQ